jgi:ABC-2 type transport system permease protein
MINLKDITKKRIQSWTVYILIILNIIAFILITGKIYFRVDATEGQKYSISKSTVDLLKKIDNTLVIEYYYSDKAKEVTQIAQIIQYIDDILQEYENNSNGKINKIVRELSYEKDQAQIDEIQNLGIQSVPLIQRGQGESKSVLGFSGIVIRYKDKTSVIPSILNDAGFEYNLDLEIKKLIGDSDDKVGVICATMGRTYEKDFAYVKQFVEKEYKDAQVIQSGSGIPEDIGILLILGGDSLTDYDIYQIDQFLVNGGRAFVALSGINVIIQQQYGMFGMPSGSKLIDLLGSYGLNVHKDLVGDSDSCNEVGQENISYPVWPIIKSENLNKNHMITKSFEGLFVVWPSSITVSDRIKEYSEPLFHTTKGGWDQTADFKIDPNAYAYSGAPKQTREFNLAYAFKGPIESYFKDKPIPKNDASANDKGPKIKDASADNALKANLRTNGKTQIVLVGSEYFITNDFLQRSDELIFMLNSLNWLQKDNSLIPIRDKGKFSKPLDKARNPIEKEKRKNFVIIVTTIIIPVLFIILAVLVIQLRNIRNRRIKEEFFDGDSSEETPTKEGDK